MFKMSGLWIIFLVQIILVAGDSPKCEKSDTACLVNTGQETVPVLTPGIPDIGAPSLDPLHLDKVTVNLAGLNLLVRDANIKGLRKSVIDKIEVDRSKKILEVRYHTDLVMKNKYKASGQLLILPISGDGDMTLKLKHLQVDMTMPFEYGKNANGDTILDLKSFSLKYDVRDNAHFHLTNLFNGNKELSDAMLNFMNTSWKILTEEFGLPILTAGHQVIFDALKAYMATQPIEE